jgi:hypothetical protein
LVVLEMSDQRLDGGTTLHLAANGFGAAANPAADPDLEPAGGRDSPSPPWMRRAAIPVSFSAMTGPSVWPS